MNNKSFLLMIAFICGAVVMGIELVGSRILSPFFGNSIFVWGSLISVFMGALSLGYYIGGWYSDKNPSINKLAMIIFFSAIFILLIPVFGKSINNFISGLNLDVRWASLFSSLILFFAPIAALGVVSPYIIKMNTSELDKIGMSAGSVYAISTLGSIIGTIATSFYLISLIGVSAIFYCYGILLIIISILMVTVGILSKKKSLLQDKCQYL